MGSIFLATVSEPCHGSAFPEVQLYLQPYQVTPWPVLCLVVVPVTLELLIPQALGCSWLSVLSSHLAIPFPFWAVNCLDQGWHCSRRSAQCSHPQQEP